RQPLLQRDAIVTRPQQDAIERAAAEPEQARVTQSLKVDEHARSQRERADLTSRLTFDDVADRERCAADQDAIANLDTELQEQVALYDDATIAEQAVVVGRAAGQFQRAVERKPGPDTLEFDHPGRSTIVTLGPHHRRRLDDIEPRHAGRNGRH